MRQRLIAKQYSEGEWIINQLIEMSILVFILVVLAPTPTWATPPESLNLISILSVGAVALGVLLLRYLVDVQSLSNSTTDALQSLVDNTTKYQALSLIGVVWFVGYVLLFGGLNTGFDTIIYLITLHLFLMTLKEICLETVVTKSDTEVQTSSLSAEEVSNMSRSDWDEF